MCSTKDNIRPLLAKLIINKLSFFTGDDELRLLADKDSNTLYIHRCLAQTSLEVLIDIRGQAQKIPLEARTLKHHLQQVYDGLMSSVPPDNKFSGSLIYILFIFELCYCCLERDKTSEVRSIHEFASRILQRDGYYVIKSESSWSSLLLNTFNFVNIYKKLFDN